MEEGWLIPKKRGKVGECAHPKPASHLVLCPLGRADPEGLSSICPQPPVGPRGPLKPPGRSQVSEQLRTGLGLSAGVDLPSMPSRSVLQSHRPNHTHE